MTFTKRRALGAGFDKSGEFTYSGDFGGSKPVSVRLTKELIPKTGPGSSLMIVGEWTGSCIKAAWWDYHDPAKVGKCEMWPVDKDLALAGGLGMTEGDEVDHGLIRLRFTDIIDFGKRAGSIPADEGPGL